MITTPQLSGKAGQAPGDWIALSRMGVGGRGDWIALSRMGGGGDWIALSRLVVRVGVCGP
jgi:hypothetical protein